ncbi:class I SAM-dependent methyltransferase [Corynebacterium tapiri]
MRPSYPPEVTSLLNGCDQIVDIGAGTGKFVEKLNASFLGALDPSPAMVSIAASKSIAHVWQAVAESTGLADNSVDGAVIAQTWHWLDASAVCQELDRILSPGGKVVLAWNTLDVSHPWILRLARIIHSGDIHREGFVPEVHYPWTISREVRTRWVTHLRTDQLHLLAHTRSYWLKSSEKVRQRVTDNLNWYLHERLEFQPGQLLPIPYRTDAFVLERS